jgi:putative transposase
MTDMKKSGFTEEQIIGFLRQAEAGIPVKDFCRNGGFSDMTLCSWWSKFGVTEPPSAE